MLLRLRSRVRRRGSRGRLCYSRAMKPTHHPILRVACCLGLVVAVAALLGTRSVVRIRPPVGAGPYYPADKEKLVEVIKRDLEKAQVEPLNARILACIAPYAGFGLSGPVTMHAFKELKPGQYDRVIVLAPSNYATFEGCSIPSVQAFATPLGIIPLDGPAIHQLSYSSLITLRSLRYEKVAQREQLHEREFSIEVLLPPLQVCLGRFKLIPILVGQFKTVAGEFDPNALEAAARAIRGVIDERTLVVVSSNFTQYGDIFNFVPFRDNIPERIKALDDAAFSAVMSLDDAAIRAYLEQTKNPINGAMALQLLARILPAGAFSRVLAYDTSGRMTNKADQSVSYAAIDFYDLTQEPPEAKPLPAPITEEALPPEPPAEEAQDGETR